MHSSGAERGGGYYDSSTNNGQRGSAEAYPDSKGGYYSSDAGHDGGGYEGSSKPSASGFDLQYPKPSQSFRGSSAQSAHVEAMQTATAKAGAESQATKSEEVALWPGIGLDALKEKKQKEEEDRRAKREAAQAKRCNEETRKEADDEQALIECEEHARQDCESNDRIQYEAALIVRIANKFGTSGVWVKIAEARARGAEIPLDPRRVYLLAHPDKCPLPEASDATAILNAQRPPEMTEARAKPVHRQEQSADESTSAAAPETELQSSLEVLGRENTLGPASVKTETLITSEEQRVDPEDGLWCTLKELQHKYKNVISPDEIQAYWQDECKVLSPRSMNEQSFASRDVSESPPSAAKFRNRVSQMRDAMKDALRSGELSSVSPDQCSSTTAHLNSLSISRTSRAGDGAADLGETVYNTQLLDELCSMVKKCIDGFAALRQDFEEQCRQTREFLSQGQAPANQGPALSSATNSTGDLAAELRMAMSAETVAREELALGLRSSLEYLREELKVGLSPSAELVREVVTRETSAILEGVQSSFKDIRSETQQMQRQLRGEILDECTAIVQLKMTAEPQVNQDFEVLQLEMKQIGDIVTTLSSTLGNLSNHHESSMQDVNAGLDAIRNQVEQVRTNVSVSSPVAVLTTRENPEVVSAQAIKDTCSSETSALQAGLTLQDTLKLEQLEGCCKNVNDRQDTLTSQLAQLDNRIGIACTRLEGVDGRVEMLAIALSQLKLQTDAQADHDHKLELLKSAIHEIAATIPCGEQQGMDISLKLPGIKQEEVDSLNLSTETFAKEDKIGPLIAQIERLQSVIAGRTGEISAQEQASKPIQTPSEVLTLDGVDASASSPATGSLDFVSGAKQQQATAELTVIDFRNFVKGSVQTRSLDMNGAKLEDTTFKRKSMESHITELHEELANLKQRVCLVEQFGMLKRLPPVLQATQQHFASHDIRASRSPSPVRRASRSPSPVHEVSRSPSPVHRAVSPVIGNFQTWPVVTASGTPLAQTVPASPYAVTRAVTTPRMCATPVTTRPLTENWNTLQANDVNLRRMTTEIPRAQGQHGCFNQIRRRSTSPHLRSASPTQNMHRQWSSSLPLASPLPVSARQTSAIPLSGGVPEPSPLPVSARQTSAIPLSRGVSEASPLPVFSRQIPAIPLPGGVPESWIQELAARASKAKQDPRLWSTSAK